MRTRFFRRVRTSSRGDEGVGLILVIGVSVFVFLLAAVAVSYAVNGISQSRQRTTYEKGLASAEAGVDFGLAKVQSAFSEFSSDFPIPSTPTLVDPAPACNATAIGFPTSGDGSGGVFSSEDAERTWATTELQSLVGVAGCIRADDDGEYVVLKPVGINLKYGRVYALSAIPSFADAGARTRLIKAEYVFMPYRPTHAILMEGDFSLSASTTVTSAAGALASSASVHSNSKITGVGNPEVFGMVTSSGTSTLTSAKFYANPGHAIVVSPKESIPRVSARGFYFQAPTNDPGAMAEWYDLCPDGAVRHYSAAGPCTAVANIGYATSTQVRGWEFNLATRLWTATSNTLSGTYFAEQANIDWDHGTHSLAKLTLIASSSNPDVCSSKRYGNITWGHYDIGAPSYANLFMFADSDLVTESNFTAGNKAIPVSGMFIAGDQIQMETSSAGAVGSVLSGDQCPSPASSGGLVTTSEIKNPSIFFDPNSAAPFSSTITTSLWLDYSGG